MRESRENRCLTLATCKMRDTNHKPRATAYCPIPCGSPRRAYYSGPAHPAPQSRRAHYSAGSTALACRCPHDRRRLAQARSLTAGPGLGPPGCQPHGCYTAVPAHVAAAPQCSAGLFALRSPLPLDRRLCSERAALFRTRTHSRMCAPFHSSRCRAQAWPRPSSACSLGPAACRRRGPSGPGIQARTSAPGPFPSALLCRAASPTLILKLHPNSYPKTLIPKFLPNRTP